MYTPRLKTKYYEEIQPALKETFGYSSIMAIPKLQKIVVLYDDELQEVDFSFTVSGFDELEVLRRPVQNRCFKHGNLLSGGFITAQGLPNFLLNAQFRAVAFVPRLASATGQLCEFRLFAVKQR